MCILTLTWTFSQFLSISKEATRPTRHELNYKDFQDKDLVQHAHGEPSTEREIEVFVSDMQIHLRERGERCGGGGFMCHHTENVTLPNSR